MRVPLEEGEWEALADGEDSFLWKNPEKHPGKLSGEAEVMPVSILVLGKR